MKIQVAPGLPITDRAEEVIDLLTRHQVVVLAGETGSGKTTQLPKLALAAGAKRVVHTQPRRVAARSVAKRIAHECEVELGRDVGYAVRFDDQSTRDTKIRVVTDGLLLAELANDPDLRRYDTVIIDEAHERSLAIDFLLGYLARLVDRRTDLRVIATSATIDVERFAELFTTPERHVPIVEVSGRTFPVEIRYRPMDESDASHLPEAVADAIGSLPRDGDVLVFASGEREIRDISEYLEGRFKGTFEILALHGRLPAHEQQRIFDPGPRRRVIISTNVAETSLTVPRIRFVIDPGFARISRFSTRLKVQRLPIEPISQASAAQRAGRCGRVSDGICIRLYSEEDFAGRPEFTDPEIQRTNLASVILQMALLRLGPIEEFGFLDQPDSRAIASGKNLLLELGAISNNSLTATGRTMAALPVDPRMSRMLIEASKTDCLADVLVIVAAMSIQDPRERPMEEREKADQFHKRFHSPVSDFLSFLALWKYLNEQRSALSHTKFRAMCRNEYLHYLRVREWQDVYAQLKETAREQKLRLGQAGSDPDAIHQSMLVGLLSHLAIRVEDSRDFQGARGTPVTIWPGSGLAKKPPAWLMAAEFMETSRVWAHTVAAVEPAWIETAGAHLLKKQYAEPRWSARRGAAVATMRASLYGLPVVTDRVVNLAPHDPTLARELFIRHALVGNEWRTHHAFVRRNEAKLADLAELEERTRRRDLMVSDDILFEFFNTRVPDRVVSVRHFDSWWRKEKSRNPHFLDITDEAVGALIPHIEDEFPTFWSSQSDNYELGYVFEPGDERDGVHITIDLTDLPTANPSEFEWHVPGTRAELITALIKSLPKPIRRNFAPASTYAERALGVLDSSGEPLTTQLAKALSQTSPVSPDDFDWAGVPDHLRFTFVVTGDCVELGRGKDLVELKRNLAPKIRGTVRASYAGVEASGLREWPEQDIPHELNEGIVPVWPALVDEGASAGIRVFTNGHERDVSMVRGTARLMAIDLPDPSVRLVKGLSMVDALMLSTAGYRDAAALVHDAWLTALDSLIVELGGPVWTAGDFAQLKDRVRQEMVPRTQQVLTRVLNALKARARMDQGAGEAGEDVANQVSWLIYPGFVRDMTYARLPRLAVYFAAAQRRLASTKDPEPVYALEARFHALTSTLTPLRVLASDVAHVRWALEEFRVSWFAQDLGTAFSVSEKKVTAMLDAMAATLDAEISQHPTSQ